jgi:hypothetical protein
MNWELVQADDPESVTTEVINFATGRLFRVIVWDESNMVRPIAVAMSFVPDPALP